MATEGRNNANMKRLFLIAVSLMLLTEVCAQTDGVVQKDTPVQENASVQKDVTRFLGIPIDGTKAEMIQKLKAKGFTSSLSDSDALTGEFNGRKVNIYVGTNNNKVYRIMVADAKLEDETNIRIHFNHLCEQFKNNKKYISFEDYTIPESEDISYEMIVHKKRYEAGFYQISDTDTEGLYWVFKPVWLMIHREYGNYKILMYYDNKYNQANGEDL